jgi:CRP/FNR family cyclic AMP-dependent transcriptional regulator
MPVVVRECPLGFPPSSIAQGPFGFPEGGLIMVSTGAEQRFRTASWSTELDDKSRVALLSVLEEDRADAGVMLLTEGAPNDRVRFLLEGEVAILRDYPGHGVEQVTTLAAPTVFGTTSFFGAGPPIVSARAVSSAWFLSLSRPAFERLRQLDPHTTEQFMLAVVTVLADRFNLLDRKLAEFLHQPDHPARKNDEWNAFRARFLEESSL